MCSRICTRCRDVRISEGYLCSKCINNRNKRMKRRAEKVRIARYPNQTAPPNRLDVIRQRHRDIRELASELGRYPEIREVVNLLGLPHSSYSDEMAYKYLTRSIEPLSSRKKVAERDASIVRLAEKLGRVPKVREVSDLLGVADSTAAYRRNKALGIPKAPKGHRTKWNLPWPIPNPEKEMMQLLCQVAYQSYLLHHSHHP